jgi:hypothetical protein
VSKFIEKDIKFLTKSDPVTDMLVDSQAYLEISPTVYARRFGATKDLQLSSKHPADHEETVFTLKARDIPRLVQILLDWNDRVSDTTSKSSKSN